MDPLFPIPLALPVLSGEPSADFVAYPAFYFVPSENNTDLLSSLDSDTRAYVLKNTSEDRTRDDVVNCIYDLKKKLY